MKDLVTAAVAAVVFLITYTPTDLATKLEPWKPSINWLLLAALLWLAVRFGHYWARKKDARNAEVASFVLIAKTVRDDLISWHKIDAQQVDQQLRKLERSEAPVWIEDKARHARHDFVLHARGALAVRAVHENYRNEIERSNHEEYLDNTRDRLVAALLKKRMPAMFDPYDDGEPSWRHRLRSVKRRFMKKFRSRKRAENG